jgi:hypothetical protein
MVNHPTRCSKLQFLVVVLGVSCLLLQSASATLLFSESFNYTPGTALSGNGPWTTGSSPGLTIGSGNLTYAGLADQGGNELSIANGTSTSGTASFANQTSGQIFYSFLFDPTVVDGGNNYFTAMNPGTGGPNGGSDAIDVYYYSSGKIELRGNAQSATAGTGAALTLGTTYFIVEELDLNAKTASLWIDPTPGAGAPTATATLSGLTATSVDDVGFKAVASTGSYLVDNLLIGTTWADVTPAIPEPSTVMLVGAGLGLMAAALRRRRS